MARAMSPFTRKFLAWLAKKNYTGMQAAQEANYAASVAAVNNWKQGQLPSIEKCRQFFGQFPDEDIEKWLKLLVNSRRKQEMTVLYPDNQSA